MGLVAFASLLAAEIGLAGVAFGQSPVDYVLRLRSLPAAIGLWAQIAFASFPLLQATKGLSAQNVVVAHRRLKRL